MKQLLSMFALVAVLATQAVAGDFNNTGVSIGAQGEKFGVTLGTGASRDFASDAQVLGINTNGLPVNGRVEIVDNGTNRDYRLTAGKAFEAPIGSSLVAYVVPELHYTWGDSYTNKELRVSPYAGVDFVAGPVTPFAEMGYDWKSLSGDHANFSKADSYAKIGVRVPVAKSADLTVSVLHKMDKDFNKTENQAMTGLTVRF